ncbi:Peptidase [Phytophthora palmivora]|uniref:S-formylglutathione hydrolase n=1 Tax=Phytophthora palmivora TaxID=4796 RepID=A0A2P4XZ58_9STRA|nr:Peptidase [Phytophthora palmivora]
MTAVTLHVYDLSHGMAQQLSPALLGKTIDGVWHTGVLVFGKEYFFGGGGIQAMAPELVVQRYGMQPLRTLPLGETSLSQQQFEQFLRENSARFTDATYDLLRHNCNNFSDEVAKFLVGSGIPQYILDLPNEALNSPFGAMLRPMLENMNNQMHAAPGDQLFSIPFNDPSRANLAVPAATTSASTNSSVNLASRRFKISGSPALHLDKIVQRIKSLNSERLLLEDEISALEALSTHVAGDCKEVDGTKSVEWWKIVSKLISQTQYKSISAFAPISHPSQCPWGIKAFTGYLGVDQETWKEYDATQLILNQGPITQSILIDQGREDNFLHDKQLLPEAFEAACNSVGQKVTLRMQDGYDHSYYFIASFVEDHVNHHADALLQ